MNSSISKTRDFLIQNGLDYLLVNATNEFLTEYNSLEENSRYFLTGFSGSTGDAIVSKNSIYLIVDGRYHIQADLEVNHDDVTVIKLQTGEKVINKIFEILEPNSCFGLCSKKNSQFRYENMVKKFEEKSIKVKLVDEDCLQTFKNNVKQNITEIPLEFTGKSKDTKISELTKNLLPDEAILVTNLEDLSYITNLRNFDKSNSSSINGKGFFTKNKHYIFKDDNLKDFELFIKDIKGIDTIYADKHSITAYDYKLLGNKVKELKINPVKTLKSIKTKAEIEHYKDAFRCTDLALQETRKFIEESDNISEYDIKCELENAFKKYGAVSQSFTSIVAKDENSALAHYSKSSKTEIIKDGSLVLIDCGGFYKGGLATDCTRVFVKGTPLELQKQIYTLVLKSFLLAFNKKDFECGQDIDKAAREFLEEKAPAGFVFNHGLGHGIGVNVHDNPPRLACTGEESLIPIQDNMCFTIEPGLYKQNVFGVRLENSCYFENGEIKSFTNMCYEKKLIDYTMLTDSEKEQLSHFEVK